MTEVGDPNLCRNPMARAKARAEESRAEIETRHEFLLVLFCARPDHKSAQVKDSKTPWNVFIMNQQRMNM